MRRPYLIWACVTTVAVGATAIWVYFDGRLDDQSKRGAGVVAPLVAREDGTDPRLETGSKRIARPNSGGARPGAHYSNLATLIPVEGRAIDVIDALTPAAQAGDAGAALSIYVKANDCRLRSEAAHRSAPSTNPLTVIPLDCQGLTREDYLAAGKWVERAADAGSIDAQFLYSTSPEGVLGPPSEWLRDPEGVARYKRKAMAFMTSHANSGSLDAMANLVTAYQYGVLTPADPVKALAYFDAAQRAGAPMSPRLRASLIQNLSPTEVSNAEQLSRSIYGSCCK